MLMDQAPEPKGVSSDVEILKMSDELLYVIENLLFEQLCDTILPFISLITASVGMFHSYFVEVVSFAIQKVELSKIINRQ